jgi:hypothetical protein
MGLRLDAVDSVGGFDTAFSPVYYEDVDLCVRLRAGGWRVRFVPTIRATHHEGVTLERSPAYYRFLHRNRIRFALTHLSPEEWSREFVPAELERLRHEIGTVSDDEWRDLTGASAAEAVARHGPHTEDWDAATLLRGPSPARMAVDVQEALRTWEVTIGSVPNVVGRADRLRRWITGVDGRAAAGAVNAQQRAFDAAISQQRVFNAAVVRALQVQDQLNREQLATTLLLALDLLGVMRENVSASDDPPAR